MGTSTLMDLIGSSVVGGILFLMALRLNASAAETSSIYHGELKLQQDLTTLVRIIEYDFRKIGYCNDYRKIAEPSAANLYADSMGFKFLTDVDSDGNVDSIYYFLGSPDEVSYTTNPRDRLIYRAVNGEAPQGWDLGVTQLRFTFFDALGDMLTFPISDPREIFSMEISLALESQNPQNMEYTNDPSAYQVFWRQIRLVSRNLHNR